MIYHIRYALHLWQNVPGMTVLEAWRYPFDPAQGDGDPIEDADEEMSCMTS